MIYWRAKTEYDTTLLNSSFCIIDHGFRKILLLAGSILDCSLYIPPNSDGIIFSFINLSGEKDAALGDRIQRTCFLMNQQLLFLQDIDSKVEVRFFLCLPPAIDYKIVSSKFQEFADEQKRMNNVDWQIVTLKLEKGHNFSGPVIQTVKSTLKPLYGISSEFSKNFERFAPTEWRLNFSLATFTESSNKDDKLAIKLDKEGLKKFVDRYFPARSKKLITLPAFDRIKCTKLYPKQKFSSRKQNGTLCCSTILAKLKNFGRNFIHGCRTRKVFCCIVTVWRNFHLYWKLKICSASSSTGYISALKESQLLRLQCATNSISQKKWSRGKLSKFWTILSRWNSLYGMSLIVEKQFLSGTNISTHFLKNISIL